MRTLLIIAIGCALALAGCGGAASPGQPGPAQIQTQVTPAPQATPASSSTPRGYDDGY